jgi:hypothetical protein
VSDTQQGPGWWQASDGRWYPPTPPAEPQAPLGDAWPGTPATTEPIAGGRSGWKVAVIVIGTIFAGLIGIAVLSLLAIAFLGRPADVDRTVKMSELGDQSEEMKREARASLRGVFTPGESDCLIDGLLQRDDLTAGQILDYAKAPATGGPVEAAYSELAPGCLDPNATVESTGPPPPELRTAMVKGAVNSGLTEDEANCMFDALVADGWTARDLTLAGYLPERQQELTSAVQRVAGPCFPPGP